MLQDLNKCGPPPPIYFKTDPAIGKKPNKNQDSLKVDINTKLWDINTKNYIPLRIDLQDQFLRGTVEVLHITEENTQGSEPDHRL